MDPTLDRYLNGDYARKNPDWDSDDAQWKVGKLCAVLASQGIVPRSIVEIGCGSGSVLVGLRDRFPEADLTGFDIAPELQRIWQGKDLQNIQLQLGDYLDTDMPTPDLIVLLDVLEHVGNPWEFLARLRSRAGYVAIHFPLDLSALSVFREKPLLRVRDKVGHLHFYTRTLALKLVEEAGFEVIAERYTDAALDAPQRGMVTKFAALLRRSLFAVDRDLAARLVGGQTLIVLARPLEAN